MTENEQENSEIKEQDHSETNELDHSEINGQVRSEKNEQDPSEINGLVLSEISDQDRLETNETENQVNVQDRLQGNEVISRSKNSEQVLNEAENQEMNDQDHLTSDAATENRDALSDRNLTPIDQDHLTTDAAVGHSVQSTDDAHHDHGQQMESGSGQASGWSKWKNKVKTFFQKLFA